MLNSTPLFPDGDFRRVGDSAVWADGLVSSGVASYPLVGIGRLNSGSGRFRGGRFIPVGRGADDAAFTYNLYAVQVLATKNEAPAAPTQLDLIKLGGGTATLGTMVGAAGLPIADTDRVADTLTFTAEAATTPGGRLLAALTSGSIAVASPGSNGRAHLVVPDLGAQYAVAFEVISASTAIVGRFMCSLWV